MKTGEYTIKELNKLIENMSGMYDIARVVDPTECRVLKFQDDGRINMSERCYSVWNADQRCVNCSSAVACKTGCHHEKSERFQDQVYNIQSNPVKIDLPDGDVYNAVLELVSIKKDNDPLAQKAVNDREAENEDGRAFRYLTFHDALTATLRSDAFYEQARDLLTKRSDERFVMITSDIMEFRLVNSLFGVEKGNEALVRIAKRLKRIADGCGGLCGRLHGDHFALLLPAHGFRESDLTDTAKEMKDAFGSGVYTLCVQFGVYEIADGSIPVSVMCDRANMALRTIYKSVGTAVARFDDAIMQKSLYEHKIISSFDEALENGQFQMFLQPITDGNGKPFGAEALARWVHPDKTVTGPGGFIDTLENAGLIHRLDCCIWEQAVRQLDRWKDTARKDLTISVNISAKDFYSMDIYEVLTGLTEKYGVANDMLRLEITESALIEDPEHSYPVISKLQGAGFLVEIDDFGKGQSSLSLLKDIKADILKIDMGFLRETEDMTRSQIILGAVIAMATALGMQVITEGVETENQLSYLTSMGCGRFQGFLFSKPVTVEEFEKKYPMNDR